jgi:hypothetical protein
MTNGLGETLDRETGDHVVWGEGEDGNHAVGSCCVEQ